MATNHKKSKHLDRGMSFRPTVGKVLLLIHNGRWT